MTTAMKLEALAPAYLEATADVAAARKILKGRSSVPAGMEARNSDHAAEVREKESHGAGPLITNGTAQRMGSGSGFEVVYKRCQCDGFEVECFHDVRQSPYSESDIAGAEKAVKAAEKALAKAEKHLAGTDPSFDAFENARSVGAKFCWWPESRGRDPRKFRYRGMPLTDEDVQKLGAHALRRAITNGSVIEVE